MNRSAASRITQHANSLVGDPFFEKGLPSNLEAERSILGAILLDNSVCNQAMELMRRDDFFLDSHRRIYDKMILLSERGSSIDLITLSEELHRASEFEQVGGATYVASLIDGVPRTDTIEPYATIVKEKHLSRSIISLLDKTISNTFEGEDEPQRILADLENQVIGLVKRFDSFSQRKVLYTIEELKGLKPAEWLIPDLLARGALTLLVGQSGSYKTFFTLSQMLFLSTKNSVVYVAAEGQPGISKRVEAWKYHHKILPGHIFFWIEAVDLLNRSETTRFIRAIEKIKPDAVVFDTLSRCMPGGNENAPDDMTAFISSCGRIQSELNAAVWVNHHPKKGYSSERGHSSLRGAVDIQIEISNDDGLVTVHCEKSKDDEPFEKFFLRPVKIYLSEDLDSLVLLPASKVIEAEKLNPQARKVLEALALEVFEETGAKATQLIRDTGIPESSIYRLLSSLKRKEFITQSKSGEPYFIAESGRKALNSQELSNNSQDYLESSL